MPVGTFLAQFPNFTKQTLGVDHVTLSVFMAVFTLGIGFGGLLNNTLLKRQVCGRFVPAAALGITVFIGDLYAASTAFERPAAGAELLSFPAFLESSLQSWRILFDLLAVSVCGGLFVVPLNALMQDRTDPKVRARIESSTTTTGGASALVVCRSTSTISLDLARSARIAAKSSCISACSALVSLGMPISTAVHKRFRSWSMYRVCASVWFNARMFPARSTTRPRIAVGWSS